MLMIKPYESVGQARFGMTVEELVAVLGAPLRVTTNRRGELGYEYQGFVIRFSADSKRVAEIGITPQPDVQVTELPVDVFSSDDAFARLIQKDAHPYEYMGFVILMELGMTLTGFHDSDDSQRAITVFEKGRWDSLRPQLKAFRQP